jgi:hypothetical protein
MFRTDELNLPVGAAIACIAEDHTGIANISESHIHLVAVAVEISLGSEGKAKLLEVLTRISAGCRWTQGICDRLTENRASASDGLTIRLLADERTT